MLRLVPLAVRTGLALWRVVFFSSGCRRGVVGGVIREMCSCEGWVVGYTLRRELQGEFKVQKADIPLAPSHSKHTRMFKPSKVFKCTHLKFTVCSGTPP